MPESSPSSSDDPLAALQLAKTSPTLRRRRRRPRGLLTLAILGLLVAAVVTFQQITAVPLVQTALVMRQSPIADKEITTANGYVVARTRASVASKVQGRLIRVLVDEGDLVVVDQLLAEVEHEELDAQVTEAAANLAAVRESVPIRQARLREVRAAEATFRASVEEQKSAVAEAEAVFKESQASFQRTEYLFNKQIRGDADLDEARQARDVAKARVDLAKTALLTAESRVVGAGAAIDVAKQQLVMAKHEIDAAISVLQRIEASRQQAMIKAPFAGMVLRREAEPGEVVSPANTGASGSKTAVVTLADFASLEIEVDVYERDIAKIERGTACRIILDAYPQQPLAGEVRLLRPTADRSRATIQAYVTFAEVPAFARPEMGSRVSFFAGEVDVLAPDRIYVPSAAVTERDGREGVLALIGNKLRFRPLRLGPESEGLREVLEGIDAGETVVLAPLGELVDGLEVRVAGG